MLYQIMPGGDEQIPDKLYFLACRQLVCKVEEIQQTLRKHLAKEEDQLFPLLLKHFTFAEQVIFTLLSCPGKKDFGGFVGRGKR